MPAAVTGPLLRHVEGRQATVWVETDVPGEVEVATGSTAGGSADTFTVAGHHYAIVVVNDVPPGAAVTYEVRLDGRQIWPLPGAPPSVIRIPTADEQVRVAFGSCLASAPQEEPYTIHRRDDEDGLGPDALRALSLRVQRDPTTRPDGLLLLGDQVYADKLAPEMRAWVRARRDVSEPPGYGVADFEEYAELYRQTWADPAIRWLLSTVPTSMMFDDHEIIDDWNISQDWLEEIDRQPWWDRRLTSGLASYWVYQHLGNLPVDELQADPVLRAVREADDGAEVLFAAARDWQYGTAGTTGIRWSYRRVIGPVDVLVVDSRNGRVLDRDHRAMLDEHEFSWLEEQAGRARGHLIVASSVPWLLSAGIHEVEGWNEALASGAWGDRVARWAEKVRQDADLEHWAAFRSSWDRLARLLERAVRDPDPEAPRSAMVLSGDVHYSYAMRLHFSDDDHRPVWQITSSPLRYPTPSKLERAFDFATTAIASGIGGLLARTAGVPSPPARWKIAAGPYQHNGVAELVIDRSRARVVFLGAYGSREPGLEVTGQLQLV